jgi:hypothetical protein
MRSHAAFFYLWLAPSGKVHGQLGTNPSPHT